jgi:hypothetical protein
MNIAHYGAMPKLQIFMAPTLVLLVMSLRAVLMCSVARDSIQGSCTQCGNSALPGYIDLDDRRDHCNTAFVLSRGP